MNADEPSPAESSAPDPAQDLYIVIDGQSYRFRTEAPDPAHVRDCFQRVISRQEAEIEIREIDAAEYAATQRIWIDKEQRYCTAAEIEALLAEMNQRKAEIEQQNAELKKEVLAEIRAEEAAERLLERPAPKPVM